jgi:hypothetical protein
MGIALLAILMVLIYIEVVTIRRHFIPDQEENKDV